MEKKIFGISNKYCILTFFLLNKNELVTYFKPTNIKTVHKIEIVGDCFALFSIRYKK